MLIFCYFLPNAHLIHGFQVYVLLKDSLEHGFTGLQVYIGARKLDNTLDGVLKLYL